MITSPLETLQVPPNRTGPPENPVTGSNIQRWDETAEPRMDGNKSGIFRVFLPSGTGVKVGRGPGPICLLLIPRDRADVG